MNNGIKPTRLWHLTGKKHFRNLIQDKVTARPRFEQRNRWEKLKIVGLVVSALATICYTYGIFSPEKGLTTIIRPPGACDPPKKKCVKPKVIPPCPPAKDSPPSKPCS